MEILVLGHSGTAGYGVRSRAETWPGMLEEMLRERGFAVSVGSVDLFPVGDGAVEYAMRKVYESSPGVVVLSVNAFPCAVPVVGESVRRRFGGRVERVYRVGERVFEASPVGRWRPADRLARRVARRTLGALPLATVEEVGRVYTGIIRELSQREQVEVVAIAESRFGPAVQQRLPGVLAEISRLHAMVRPEVDAHRMTWVDAEDGLEGQDKSRYYQPDGVHSSVEGARCYATMLAPVVSGFLGGGRLEEQPA